MNVSGEFTIKAPRAAVFDTIRDPKSFISLVDGIRDLTTARIQQRFDELAELAEFERVRL